MRFLLMLILPVLVAIVAACGGTTPNLATPQRPPLSVPTTAPTSVQAPTAGLVTATPEPLNAPAVTQAPQGQATAPAPAETEIPAAPVLPTSRLFGTYSGILPAADAVGRVVTLELAIDGSATMTTQFIGKGNPIVESGTWVQDGDKAVVTFTQVDGQPEDNRITWTLQAANLATTEYDQGQYGTAGLPLTRVGTGDIIETNFEGVSFSFDAALAKSAKGTFLAPRPVEQAPALGGGAPAGVQFVFDDENLPDFFDPTKRQVYVYPVEGLKALDPSVAQGVADLQKILADGTVEPDQQIPVFPLIPSNQVFHAQARLIDFVNGTGVGFITYYAQDVSPIQSERVFWTFQGITLDEKYYVSVFLPIGSPALPASETISGSAYDAFVQEYPTYLKNLVTTLNSVPPAGLVPNLTLLENLARSVNASPLFPTPTPAPEATSASAQEQATPQAAPTVEVSATAVAGDTPAPTAGQMISTEFRGVQFSFSDALAKSAQGVTIPAAPVDTNAPVLGGGAPEHIAFGFNGEPVTADVSPFQPGVRVYLVEALKDLDPAVTREVLALKTLLSVDATQLNDPLPVFPLYNAQQILHPQIKYLNFKDGEGVRFVTFYAQDVAPVTNDGLFYTFQGLSADGKYYVTVFYPVKTDKLPNTYQDANITDMNAWAKQYENYLKETDAALNSLGPEGFTPNLTLLDRLVESLIVPK